MKVTQPHSNAPMSTKEVQRRRASIHEFRFEVILKVGIKVNGMGEKVTTHVYDTALRAPEDCPPELRQELKDNALDLAMTAMSEAIRNVVNKANGIQMLTEEEAKNLVTLK